MIKNITIKWLIISAMLFVGIAAIVLSIIGSYAFRDVAISSQQNTLSRILDVSSNDSIRKLNKLGVDLATDTKRESEFKKASKKTFKDTSDANVQNFEKVLSNQFSQRYVTAGIVDLKKIRVYDLGFKLVAQSTEGIKNLPDRLTASLYDIVVDRKGPERLKSVDALWLNANEPLYSVLVPIGGLRIRGYMEVVLSPAHNLFKIKEVLDAPLSIYDIANNTIVKTDDWDEESANTLTIQYSLKDRQGKSVLKLEARENVELLFNTISTMQQYSIMGFVTLIGAIIAVIFLFLRKSLFTPISVLLNNMSSCASGDLTVDIKADGLKDIRQLSNGLGELVGSLKQQVMLIQKTSQDVSGAASEVNQVTLDTNEGIRQQQLETDQVATAINEMTATVSEVAQNATDAAEAANNADEESQKGQNVVNQTIEAINGLASDVQNSSAIITKLEENVVQIETILDVIKGIAEQTNLLALNAAIEAARAGEQGRGFAVVADEVRTLAQRTQESTQEIQNMIETLQKGAQEAVSAMESNQTKADQTVQHANATNESLKAISDIIHVINNMNAQIATASEEQSAVTEEINRNIISITQVAEKTTEGSQQTSSASQQLIVLAQQQEVAIDKFKI